MRGHDRDLKCAVAARCCKESFFLAVELLGFPRVLSMAALLLVVVSRSDTVRCWRYFGARQ